MVNENFKIGIELELDQTSLAQIQKKIEQAVRAAFENSTAAASQGASKDARRAGAAPVFGAKPAVPGGAATGQSMSQAAGVTQKDFTAAVKEFTKSSTVAASRFDDAASQVAASLEKFATAMNARRASGGGSPTPTTDQMVDNAALGSNRNRAEQIRTNRKEGGRQVSSGGQTESRVSKRKGTDEDRPNYQKAAKERVAAREAPAGDGGGGGAGPMGALKSMMAIQSHAEQKAKAVASALDGLAKDISGFGALSKIPDLLARIDLPTGKNVRVGEGASVEIKTLGGQTKIVTQYIKMLGTDITQFTDVVSKRTAELKKDPRFKKRIEQAERAAVTDPDKAVSIVRKLVRDVTKLPTAKRGGAQAFAKAGEGTLEIDFADFPEIQDKLMAEKDEAKQIAILNKELFNVTKRLKELGKLPPGMEVMSSTGLSEERAAEARILTEGVGQQKYPVGATMPVQMRDLGGKYIGGAGSSRAARTAQPYQAVPMIHGEEPKIKGKLEAEAYKAGMYKPGMAVHAKTAYVDPRQASDVSEDQAIIDKKLADTMGAWEPRITQPLKELAAGLEAGQKLVQGQVIGYDAEGQEVKFDLKGAEAEIEEIQNVVEHGLHGVRIKAKELYPMMTGSKMGTTGGQKVTVKVEEDMAKKRGLEEGTQVMMSGYGSAKRGAMSDEIKMASSEIARQAGGDVTGQDVADKIAAAMEGGAEEIHVAAKEVAASFGVEDFTQAGKGRIPHMVGEQAFQRLPDPRVQGPADIGTSYFDMPTMRNLQQRAGTDKMSEDMMGRMAEVTATEKEFVATLKALAGATDVAEEGLRTMLPEEFKKLPSVEGVQETFAGGVLDPAVQKEAAAIRMPERGGGEKLFRMPAMGGGLGERTGFKTALGAMGPDPITRKIDSMMQTASSIRVGEGRVAPDVTAGGEVAKDAAFKAKEAINQQVEAILKLNLTTKKGEAAARKFINELLPVIEALNTPLTEGIEFHPLDESGARRTKKPITTGHVGELGADFIKRQKTVQQQLYATRDVLAGRPKTKGKTFENVRTGGELFKDFELLQKIMEKLGITVEKDAASVEALYQHLDKLEGELISMMSAEAFPTSDPESEKKRAYASQVGAGLGLAHKELTAVQMPTDVDQELKQVTKTLDQLGASGQNVDEALAAVNKMSSISTDVAKIPRDAVFLNKQDYDNLVKATMRDRKIGREEAERRIARPGLQQRYPVTGGASFLATRAMVDPTGTVPAGKVGVAGPMESSSPEDLAAMLKPLKELEQSLYRVIETNKGQGAAADSAREQLEDLVPTLAKLQQLFLSTALNLDFDGDKIRWFADTATKAGSGVETFTQTVEKGGVSFQQMMLNLLGKVKGGKSGDINEYAEMFGKTVRARPAGSQSATLAPQTGETAKLESMAHIAGKKSVGLLTDAFNKISVAITSGTAKTKKSGDAFATGLDYIMLNINKSLSQKSGEGGTAGPLEFLEDFKAGRLHKIREGMKGKEGIYGEMGEHDRGMRDQMTKEFTGTFHRKGAEGLRGIAKAEGIEDVLPENLTYDNFKSVVDKMVNQLSLPALMTRMFEQMRDNMREGLKVKGLSKKEIESEMAAMAGGGREGTEAFDRGLTAIAPAYMSTRKKEMERVQQRSPMEQAQHVMKLFPKELAHRAMDRGEFPEIGEGVEEFEMDLDPKAEAAQIAARVRAWYDSIEDSFKPLEGSSADKKLEKQGMTPEQRSKVYGMHVPAKGGKPGQIYMSQKKRIDPLKKAMEDLDDIAAGGTATPQKLGKIAAAIARFGTTSAHENIHKASAKFPKAVNDIVRSMNSGTTALAKDKQKLLKIMSRRPNIRAATEKVKEQAIIAKERGVESTPQLKRAQANLSKTLGGELLAYQTDPAFKDDLEKGGVSKESIGELTSGFDYLRDKEPELIKEAMEVTQQAAQAVVTGLKRGLHGEGGGGAWDAEDTKFGKLSQRLRGQEAMVSGGTRELGLPSLRATEEGAIAFGEPMGPVPESGEAGEYLSEKISGILAQAREGFPDMGKLTESEREIRSSAGDLRSTLQVAEKDEGKTVGKGAGQAAYVKVIRDFHQAVSVSFLNRARQLEKEIGELKSSGGAKKDPAKLDTLMKELTSIMDQHEQYMQRTIQTVSGGMVTSHLATAKGEPVEAVKQYGLEPSAKLLQQEVGRIAGPADEGVAFMKQMAAAIDFATDEMAEGQDQTKAWSALLEALSEEPKLFHQNLVKVAAIMEVIGGHTGWTTGKLSEASQGFKELSQHAKNVAKATEGFEPEDKEDIRARSAEFPKAAKISYAKGQGPLGQSITAQYADAEIAMQKYKKKLEKVIKTEGYQKAGAPRAFEPITKDIIDPDSQKVFQKMRIEAKRAGKQIVVSMTQGGAATNQFGNQMRSALRRVVQWGFASGVVYGLIRAFRNMTTVITEVQNKMMQLQKVMDTTITDFGAMQDAAVNMAKQFGISISEVLDGMVVYGQQGLKMNVIMERTEATLLAVNVTTLNATEATEALTAAHKVYGHEVSASAEFVDAWGAVAAKHAITAKDLANAVKRSGAAADVAGVGFDDFMGIITAIGAVTRQTGKEIATSTKFMFRAMRRPTAQKELARMDVKSLLPSGDLRPAMGIFSDIADKWDELSRAQQINLAQSMAGIRHYNSFIVLMNNFDEAVLASAHAQESQGFAIRKNALALQTFSKQMQVLRETVKKLTLEIGKAILPMVTGAVKAVGGLVDVLNAIPGPIMTGAAALGVLAVAGVKAADVVVDSLDAIFGYGTAGPSKGNMRKEGMFKTMVGGVKGVGTGLMGGAGAPDTLGPLGRGAAKARVAFEGFGRALLFTKGAAASTAVALGVATAATVLLAAGVYGLWYLNKKYSKSGKDMAKSLEDHIGRSQDLAMQLRVQKTQMDAVAMSYKKIGSAMDRLENTEGLTEALNSRTYKSAAVAAKKYSDTVADVSKAIGTIDPDQIMGLSETGGYVVGLDASFKQLTISALDARNAITAALQTKVIKAFAEDLREPKGIMKNLAQWLEKTAGGKKEFSLFGEFKQANEELKKLLDRRAQLAEMGIIDVETGQAVVEATQKRAELEAQILESAIEIKKVMEAMPAFESMEMAAKMLPGMAGAVEAGATSGIFGQGATEGSIMLKQLAKSAGTGGMFDYTSGATPALMAGTLLEKGVLPTAGVGAAAGTAEEPLETGSIAVAGTRVAELIAKSVAESVQMTGPADMSSLAKGAQLMIADVNKSTGKALYRFYDEFTNTAYEVTAQTVEEAVRLAGQELEGAPDKIAAVFALFSRKSMEEAMEETERILNMAYVGVMAGVRQPKGGMPDIGVSRGIELSPEQRAMKTLALDMERLGEIQQEMNQLTKEYSERVLSDVGGAYKTQAKSGQALKALTSDMVVLVTQLQEEAFNLSVLVHYQRAIEELGLTMEKAAEAARDANIEEKVRQDYLIETSGALKGFSEIPQIDFGKTLKELTGTQRLATEVPGFKGFLDSMKRANREREAAAQQLADVRKQRARFEEAVKELAAAGDKMTDAQREKFRERLEKGLDAGAIETIKAIEQGDQVTQDILSKQTSLQEQVVEHLRDLVGLAAGGDPSAIQAKLERSENREQAEAMLSALGKSGGSVRTTTFQALGITRDKLDEKGGGKFTAGALPKYMQDASKEDQANFKRLVDNYIEVLNAGVNLSGMLELGRKGKLPPRTVPRTTARYKGEGGKGFEIFKTMEDVAEGEKGRLQKILGMSQAAGGFTDLISHILNDPTEVAKTDADESESHADKMAKAKETIRKKEAEAYSRFRQAELEAIAGVEQSTKELLAKDPGRLAVAARDFAITIENVITDFKKAEALEYTKTKSDLEGPWARVGKPGFKTDFETRKEDLEAKRMKPMGTEDYRQMQKDLAAVEFDEKEAKIKEKQDVETAALRVQQQQAERMRTTMADALFGGQLEGSPELQKLARNYMDLLTDELATSEQAEMGMGDVAKFKGVPGLEDAARVMEAVKQQAREKAAEALGKGYRENITQPIVNELQESNRYLAQMATGAGAAALPPGATMGMAAGPGVARGVAAAATAAGAGPRPAGMYAKAAQELSEARAATSTPAAGPQDPAARREEALKKMLPGERYLTGGVDPAEQAKYEAMYKISKPEKAGAPATREEAISRMFPQEGLLTGGGDAPAPGAGEERYGKEWQKLRKQQEIWADRDRGDARFRDPEYKIPGLNVSALGPAPKSFGPGMPGSPQADLMNQLKAQQDFYATTGGQSSIDLNEYMKDRDKLPTGRSNTVQYLDSEVGRLGNDDLIAGGAPRDPDRPTSQEEIENKERKGGSPSGTKAVGKNQAEMVSILGDVSKKLDVVVAAVASMPEIAPSVEAAVSAVESLKDGLPVEIDGSVEVSNLGEVTDAVGTGFTAVGAELTDQRNRFNLFETVIDPDGVPIDQRLEELERALQGRLDENQTSIAASQEEAVAAAERAALSAADRQILALQDHLTSLRELLDQTIEDGNVRAEEIGTILDEIKSTGVELADAQSRSKAAEEQAGFASESAADAQVRAEKAEQDAAEAREKAAAAEATAQGAETAARDASDAGTELERKVTADAARTDAAKRDVDAKVDRLDEKANVQEAKIIKAQRDAAIAHEVAKAASAEAKRK